MGEAIEPKGCSTTASGPKPGRHAASWTGVTEHRRTRAIQQGHRQTGIAPWLRARARPPVSVPLDAPSGPTTCLWLDGNSITKRSMSPCRRRSCDCHGRPRGPVERDSSNVVGAASDGTSLVDQRSRPKLDTSSSSISMPGQKRGWMHCGASKASLSDTRNSPRRPCKPPVRLPPRAGARVPLVPAEAIGRRRTCVHHPLSLEWGAQPESLLTQGVIVAMNQSVGERPTQPSCRERQVLSSSPKNTG